jgi:hypothetical protein
MTAPDAKSKVTTWAGKLVTFTEVAEQRRRSSCGWRSA